MLFRNPLHLELFERWSWSRNVSALWSSQLYLKVWSFKRSEVLLSGSQSLGHSHYFKMTMDTYGVYHYNWLVVENTQCDDSPTWLSPIFTWFWWFLQPQSGLLQVVMMLVLQVAMMVMMMLMMDKCWWLWWMCLVLAGSSSYCVQRREWVSWSMIITINFQQSSDSFPYH